MLVDAGARWSRLETGSIVRVAERDSLTGIFTLNRRLFSIYRSGRRRRFAIVPA